MARTRRGLQTLAVILSLLAPMPASAETVGREDRAQAPRVVVSLDGQGNPVLPVSVHTGAKQVQARARGGLRLLGSGGAVSVTLPGAAGVSVTASGSPPPEESWSRWRGCPPTILSLRREVQGGSPVTRCVHGVGATYGLKGRVLDTRKTVLCLDEPLGTLAAARARAAEPPAKHQRLVFVHVELSGPPTGRLHALPPTAC